MLFLNKQHLCSLRDYIQRGGTRVKTDCCVYKHLVDTMKIKSVSSIELIYDYNRHLTSDLVRIQVCYFLYRISIFLIVYLPWFFI